ncbi:hypothetical protein MNBD_GAMMA16-1843 [hydrothermal vent metagenome]|uniref:Uncharacterized protein n=1 Tax=hydrothermal vent metagenome TaxID=652676 RepID=A0A3B0YXS9_9ZZZZ
MIKERVVGIFGTQIKIKIEETFSDFCENQTTEDDRTLLVVTANKG